MPALQAVGWEGLWGMLILSVACIVLYYIPGPRAGSAENANDALAQVLFVPTSATESKPPLGRVKVEITVKFPV